MQYIVYKHVDPLKQYTTGVISAEQLKDEVEKFSKGEKINGMRVYRIDIQEY